MRTILGIFLVVFSILTSCQPKPSTEPTKEKLQINIGADPQTLDPRKSRNLNERILSNMLFEGLTRENKSGKNELALAQDFSVSEDKMSYTFHLKEAYWTNGDKVKAQDFIYAWKTALEPSFPSENAYQLFCIKNAKAIKMGEMDLSNLGVLALDEKTLQVHLENPLPYFLELLSFSIFFPVNEMQDQKGWNVPQEDLISCGPFCLKKWKHNDLIQVAKNATYWDASQVHLSCMDLVMVSEETEMRMFEKEELHWAGSPLSTLSFDELESLAQKKTLKSSPMLGTVFFRLNVEKAPFNNENIRKAFALAINRESIVKHIIRGNHAPAMRLVPESMHVQKDPYFLDHDEEQARICLQKGLEELQMSLQDLPKIVFSYVSTHRNHMVSQAIQQDWKRVLGFDVELEANESKVYYGRLKQQDYQMALGSWIADFNDPINFLSVFKHKKASTNNTQWENQDYANLLDLSDQTSSIERLDLLRRCEAILMKEMPIIPVYHSNMLYVKNDHLKDVAISSLGNLDFKWAYLDNPK